ncbi:DnaJ C-terminal domain-containing protein [Kineosporia succinea]|uniref:Molecular chaperone DnaJ n=1 Tax=Kineosporia succinea TaxID=84632 RepID=A0ABT9P1R3_9ACTN|nr:DnaJ C-terminal domain-containing protein [Kineosporia succinea]MDP9826593.1 molecular chaperone DnaJ [Kineosporia succinea]
MAGQDWFEKDFYSVLGVPQNASAADIKKAYRKVARTHHPDANPGDNAAEKRFKEVGEAYAVLSDPEQRQQYDAIRAMSRGGARFTAGGAGPAGGASGAGFEDLLGNLFGGGVPGAGMPGAGQQRVRYTTTGGPGAGPGRGGAESPIFEDMLNGLFPPGSGGGNGYRSPRGPMRGGDLNATATLTFRQAMEGAQLNLRVDDPQAGLRTITARIPAGVRDGQKVRLRGKGKSSDMGGEPGDLWVTVSVEPHPIFTLDGADVRITVPVTFPEAVFGTEIEVPTPDGARVKLKVPAGTPSGRTLRARGRGVKTAKRTGDLLVTLQVAVPQRVDSKAREALNTFAEATAGENPRSGLFAHLDDKP